MCWLSYLCLPRPESPHPTTAEHSSRKDCGRPSRDDPLIRAQHPTGRAMAHVELGSPGRLACWR